MRVMLAVHDFLPQHCAGTEIYCAGLAQELQRRGHELLILTTESGTGRAPCSRIERQFEGLRVWELADPQELGQLDSWRPSPIDAAVRRALDDFRPEVLHIQHFRFLGLGMAGAARALGIRVALTLHEFDLLCARFGRMRQPSGELCERPDPMTCAACCLEFPLEEFGKPGGVSGLRKLAQRLPGPLKTSIKTSPKTSIGSDGNQEDQANGSRSPKLPPEELILHSLAIRDRLAAGRAAIQACDLVVSPSHFLAERFVAAGFVEPNEIIVSRNGQDSRGFSDLIRPEKPTFRLGYLGTVSEEKGLKVFVEAATLLSERADISFVIHGDLEVAPEFVAALHREARPKSLEFAGPYLRSQLPQILANLDAIVVPSLWYENAPLTIAEAFLAEIPVLASDLGGMAEAVSDEQDGLLFEPGNAKDLARRIEELKDRPGLHERLIEGIEPPKSFSQDAMDWEQRYLQLVRVSEAKAPPTGRAENRKSPVEGEGGDALKLSVLIPTKNGGPLFARVLDRLLAQRVRYPFEIICIDSGSEDETLSIIQARSAVRLIEIGPASFGHGKTRQKGIRAAKGELVALLSQDALPQDETLLDRLVTVFDDDAVAGAVAAQEPRSDADPFQTLRVQGQRGESKRLLRRLKGGARAWRALAPAARRRLSAFDNVASMVRREDALSIPFADRRFAEDISWGKSVILAGKSLVTVPDAVVIHSHDRGWRYEAKRVYLDHFELWEQFEFRTMPSLIYAALASMRATIRLIGAALKAPRRGLGYRILWALKAPIYAVSQNMAQYAGSRAARAKRSGLWGRVDRALRGGV